ncbi:hypothetical protein ABZP36_028273 [Zizania latifolia]
MGTPCGRESRREVQPIALRSKGLGALRYVVGGGGGRATAERQRFKAGWPVAARGYCPHAHRPLYPLPQGAARVRHRDGRHGREDEQRCCDDEPAHSGALALSAVLCRDSGGIISDRV